MAEPVEVSHSSSAPLTDSCIILWYVRVLYQISMNVLRIVITVNSCATTELVTSLAVVGRATSWTRMAVAVLVSTK